MSGLRYKQVAISDLSSILALPKESTHRHGKLQLLKRILNAGFAIGSFSALNSLHCKENSNCHFYYVIRTADAYFQFVSVSSCLHQAEF